MRFCQLAVLCLACLAATGCRTRTSVAHLERENRNLEDRLYQLAAQLDDTCRENQNLREQLEPAESESQRPRGYDLPAGIGEPSQGPSFSLESPKTELPAKEISPEEFQDRLRTDFPSENVPNLLPGPAGRKIPGSPSEEAPEWTPPEDPKPQADDASSSLDPGLDHHNTQVALITLNDQFTAGYDVDGAAGHEGIVVVIEPRDAGGRPVRATAPVSIAVLDPAMSGEAARVANWSFTAEEVANAFRKTPFGEGIRLEMRWPTDIPIHSQLHVFARYTTGDGRMLQADKNIDVEVLGQQAERRTPANTPNSSGGESRVSTHWQKARSGISQQQPATRQTAVEAVRTAAVPSSPDVPAADRPSGASEPKVQRPTWSPARR